jgi:hypothetical protein
MPETVEIAAIHTLRSPRTNANSRNTNPIEADLLRTIMSLCVAHHLDVCKQQNHTRYVPRNLHMNRSLQIC